MTAEAFAERLGARRAGRHRWMARCPAHPDQHPSLAITEGRNAVLLKCWSQGCSIESICLALGIRVADLFNDQTTESVQFRRTQLSWAEKISQECRQRRRRIALMKGYRACERRMDEIAQLMSIGNADDEHALVKEFHDALEFQRSVDAEVFG